MKTLNIVTLALVLVFTISCDTDDLIIENSVSNQTANDYFSTPSGFEDLSKSIYPLLRPISQLRELTLNGTDLFSGATAWDQVGNQLNTGIETYGPEFTEGVSEVQDMWVYNYKNINRANTVISRSASVENAGTYATTLDIRVAEAKFIRSLSLFYLVQHFGDIPMPLEETNSANKEVIRVPSADVYAQIISDLTEAEAVLPATASDYGRATKGAAQHLLARVYLTRGWNFNNSLGGSDADFTTAREYADKVIASYPMVSDYKDLFPKKSEDPTNQTFGPGDQNARNSEVVFAVQYSDQALTNTLETDDQMGNAVSGDGGNNSHSIFGGGHDESPGSPGRTSDYNRQLGVHNTLPGVWRLFDPDTDSRYALNFVENVYAVVDNPGFVPADGVAPIDIAAGDVVVHYTNWNNPATLLSERGKDVGGDLDYAVINIDEIGKIDESNYHNNNKTPMMWKFWEPGIPYGNGFGQFDHPLMRSSEAYLIAAEAIMKGASNGSIGSAADYYNAVVNRAVGASNTANMAADPNDLSDTATKSYRASGAVTIDMILDERAREFMGEGLRWYDLKRTGKLIDRAKAFNPWIGGLNYIQDHHYLRPIPLSEIDLSTNEVSQNPGY
ncbi:MAG: RagB/SusD family nutrient uptake outer membrane protein [Flavobacteriaceae bacterium]